MDLLERYVREVRRFLPAKEADDVTQELRTLLADSLEARADEEGRPVDERMVADTLRAFGEPETVADRYREPRYLIGPRLFPSFEYVAWIIAVAPAIVGFFGHMVGVVMNDATLFPTWQGLGAVMLSYTRRTLVTIGCAVVVYAILDRRLPPTWTREDIERGGRQWDPHSLPPLPNSPLLAQITLEDVGPTFWALVVWLVIVNAFPALVGVPWGHDYDYRWVPVTDLGVQLPVLALNLYWGGRLLLHVVLAQVGHWTPTLRWTELGLGLFGGAIVAWMLWTAEAPRDAGSWTAQFDKMNRLVQVALWALLAWASWLALRRVSALLRKLPPRSFFRPLDEKRPRR